ncbi:hypothetical protein [Catellatospora sp. IY07-71]|uniref:hypothetical protein n=1 Tax=Catellatospora sp. IY07-71 TaxID=2728827 RepID=UPI001BB45DBC|nr:hypothetical protein [Catellatospora sp. IY07-71]
MVGILVVGGVAAALGACAQPPAAPPAESADQVVVTTVSGYELKGDPKSAIEYKGNVLIFSGQVIRHEAPRKVDRATESGGAIKFIYTPVVVKIDKVTKGKGFVPGQEIVVRAIGGQIGNEKTEYEFGPAPEQYQVGMKLVLFTQAPVDAGDSLHAVTPNFTYVEDSAGNVFNLHEPEHKTSKTIFQASLTEWVAFNR